MFLYNCFERRKKENRKYTSYAGGGGGGEGIEMLKRMPYIFIDRYVSVGQNAKRMCHSVQPTAATC